MFPSVAQLVRFSEMGPSSAPASGVIRANFPVENLANALQAVAAAQGGDGDIGWIQFHFTGAGKVVVSAVSHHISIRYEFAGEHEGEGIVKVSGRQLFDYVRQLPPEKATLTVELPSKMTVRCGRSSARLQLIQDHTFSDVRVPPAGVAVEVKGEVLARWVDSFRDLVQVDDGRYYANGAYIWVENGQSPALNAVASDALRLAKCRLSEELRLLENDGSAVLVPKKALDEVKRVAAADPGRVFTLRWREGEDLFFALENENYSLVAKGISGAYPPYEAAIPQNITIRTAIGIQALTDSLRRALIFAEKTRVLKLLFQGNTLDIQSFTPGQKEGDESIDLLSEVASPVEVNYNGQLLAGLLSILAGSTATLEWESIVRPVKITGEPQRGLEVFYLLVPTRF